MIGLLHKFGFGRRLSNMHHQGNVKLFGQGLYLAQMLGADGVRGVRRDRRSDQRVTLPFFRETLGVAERGLPCFVIRNREVDQSLSEDGTHTCLLGLFGDDILEVVHIDIGRRPAPDHLDQPQPGARSHEFACDVPGFGGEDIFRQPLLQVEIIGDAAEERHGDMGVGVDQSRQDGFSPCDDRAPCPVLPGFECRRISDFDDALPADGDKTIFIEMTIAVHGDDSAPDNQQVDGSGVRGGPAFGRRENSKRQNNGHLQKYCHD